MTSAIRLATTSASPGIMVIGSITIASPSARMAMEGSPARRSSMIEGTGGILPELKVT